MSGSPTVRARKRAATFARDGHRCLRCGATDALTLDHILPLSKGGTWANGNLQTLCEPCNTAKGDHSMSYLASTWTNRTEDI